MAARDIRKVYDHWRGSDADSLQAYISGVRKTLQGFPMIPVLKAIVAHYRDDPAWAAVRPPFVPLPAAEAQRAIAILAAEHGFKLNFQAGT